MTDDDIRPLHYLALPYSGTEDEIAFRVRAFAAAATRIEASGEAHVVSPVFNHLLRLYDQTLPGDWAYWKSYSLSMLRRSDKLLVLRLPGWEQSRGVWEEIKEASRLEIPIDFIDI